MEPEQYQEPTITNPDYHGPGYGLDPGFAPGEPSPGPHHCGPALPIEWGPSMLEPHAPWGLPDHLPWGMPWDLHQEPPVVIPV